MKKAIIYFLVFLLSISLVLGASLSRNMPARVSPGEEVTVTFTISGMEVGKEAGVSEVVPAGVIVKSESVTGAEGIHTYDISGGNNHKWSFKAASSSCTVTYKFDAPALGTYEFDAVYALPPSNINNIKSTLTVREVVCGDGLCEGNENSDNCEADCPKPAAKPIAEIISEGKVDTGWMIVAVIVLVGLLIYFIATHKNKKVMV